MIIHADMATRIHVIRPDEVVFEEMDSCLVIPSFYKDFPLQSAVLSEQDEMVLQSLIDRDVITGKENSWYYLPTQGQGYAGVLVLGLGKRKEFTSETMRRCVGTADKALRRNRIRHVYLDSTAYPDLPVDAFVEAINLSQYRFDVYRKSGTNGEPVSVVEISLIVNESVDRDAIGRACQRSALISLAANGARHFANTASNDMTPTVLAHAAMEIATHDSSCCSCTVLEEEQMMELGMNALLGVARGGSEPPKLILLEYRHPDAKRTVALAGKGVTFDSGGISLKPPAKMHEMKFDMSGAAAVLCTLMAIIHIKPAVNVIGIIPAVTNMPGSRAQTPGDIVRAYNGKTIEVHNTDAEGRLILADAMAYAIEKYQPDCIVDIATLTGAAVIALGHIAAAIIGTDDMLVNDLIAAGEATGEQLWRLPLWKDYQKLMEGTFADLVNIGPEREAGTITGAAFIREFVGDTPWAHLDIAGTAYGVKNKPYLDSKYATGFGVRLFMHWLLKKVANE